MTGAASISRPLLDVSEKVQVPLRGAAAAAAPAGTATAAAASTTTLELRQERGVVRAHPSAARLSAAIARRRSPRSMPAAAAAAAAATHTRGVARECAIVRTRRARGLERRQELKVLA
jgi:hypothetical protein